MANQETGQVALVTGGSRGIGKAIVDELLRRGWRVFFCSVSEESVQRALEELEESYPSRVFGRAADVRDEDQVKSLVSWVTTEAGRIDCLVNNAGLGIFAPVDELEGRDWRLVLETNLNGAFYLIRHVSPVMKKRGEGWIFNIASLASKNPFAGGAAYNASKFGMLGLSEAAMLDLRHFGIRVAAIMPGSVNTEFRTGTPKAGADWMLAPEDISLTVADLLEFPSRALPSRIELRPSRPPQK